MSVARRIIKNTSALFIAQVVSSAVSLIFGVMIARELGDSIFGKFAFLFFCAAIILRRVI